MDRIKEDLMKIEDVYSIEDLNVWSLTAGKTAAIVHLQLGKLLYGIILGSVQPGVGKMTKLKALYLSSLYSYSHPGNSILGGKIIYCLCSCTERYRNH